MILVKKDKNGIYDIYLNGKWVVTRSDPDNVLMAIAELTARHGASQLMFEDKMVYG